MIVKRVPRLLLIFVFVAAGSIMGRAQEDPAKKLSAFVGKWQSEGTFANGDKVTSSLECRWSAQSDFLICEQAIKMSSGDHHQLTVYSYNGKDQDYSYTTLGDPGARPTSGNLQIERNRWTYLTTFERDGQTMQARTINVFTTPHKESFTVQFSEDGGATWKTQLEGTASKVGD